MTDAEEQVQTLGEARDRIETLLEDLDEDTPVITDADGVELSSVCIRVDGDRVVFY